MLVIPDELVTAARQWTAIQSGVASANVAAAASTVQIPAAGHDEISDGIARLFSGYGQQFHAVVEQSVAAQQFGQKLFSAASAYTDAEAASVPGLNALDQIGSALFGEVSSLVAALESDPVLAVLALILLAIVAPGLLPFAVVGILLLFAVSLLFP